MNFSSVTQASGLLNLLFCSSSSQNHLPEVPLMSLFYEKLNWLPIAYCAKFKHLNWELRGLLSSTRVHCFCKNKLSLLHTIRPHVCLFVCVCVQAYHTTERLFTLIIHSWNLYDLCSKEAMFHYILYSEPRNLYRIHYRHAHSNKLENKLKICILGLLDKIKLSFKSNKTYHQILLLLAFGLLGFPMIETKRNRQRNFGRNFIRLMLQHKRGSTEEIWTDSEAGSA